MKMIIPTIAGIALASTVALASGKPNAPVIPDQFEIKRKVEQELLEPNNVTPAFANAPTMTVTEIADEQDGGFGDCAALFEWLADALGGECHLDSDFHNPNPVGSHVVKTTVFDDVTTTKDKSFKARTKRGAKNAERFWNSKKGDRIAKKKGYDDVSATRKGRKVTLTFSKTTQVPRVVRTRVRGEGGNSSNDRRDTAADSNGMRDRAIDSGNW